MSNKVKFIGFYEGGIWQGRRKSVVSANNKMQYIIKKLNELDLGVDIVSTAWIVNRTVKERPDNSSGLNNVYYTPTVNLTCRGSYVINLFLSIMWLSSIIIFRFNKNDKVIVYHSLVYAIPLFFLKIKGCDVILEVEERYTDVWRANKFWRTIENWMLDSSHKFIFASKKLHEFCAVGNQYILLHGVYLKSNTVQSELDIVEKKHKLIYSGAIETVRNGAFNSLGIIEHLPDNYYLTIIGYGNPSDIINLEKLISSVNMKRNKVVCEYKGLLTSDEYKLTLTSSSSGLNPINPGEYMDTAFPSKILDYLNHGLEVYSTTISSLTNSDVSGLVHTIDGMNYSDWAKSIIDAGTLNNQEAIVNLDIKFKFELERLLGFEK